MGIGAKVPEDISQGGVALLQKKKSQANINAIKRVISEISGPEHPENRIVKKFERGFITIGWDRLLERTVIYFHWFVKTASLSKSKVAHRRFLNPADRNSRLDSIPEDVGYTSEWKKGLYFLKLPGKDWPLERNFWPLENNFWPLENNFWPENYWPLERKNWPLEKKDWPLERKYWPSEINGAAEAFFKTVKRTSGLYGGEMITAHELNTAIKRVAAILYSRPVAALVGSKGGEDTDFITPLTPNMMLLGRVNTDIPLKSYENTVVPLARLE